MTKYKLQEMPDFAGDGKRRVYPKVVTNRTLSTEDFIEKLHTYDRALPASVVGAVIDDVADTLAKMLSMGYNVKLKGIGTFSLSLDFADKKPVELKGDDDRMSYRKVTVRDMNLKTDPCLLKKLRADTELVREIGGVNVINKTQFTLQERIDRALELIGKNGFFTLSDYAAANQICRTAASRELRQLCLGQDAVFRFRGNGTHKVWVANDSESKNG